LSYTSLEATCGGTDGGKVRVATGVEDGGGGVSVATGIEDVPNFFGGGDWGLESNVGEVKARADRGGTG
jgi:hypothetical protein